MSGQGFHILLNREDAKKLFALREPDQIRDFCRQLSQSQDYRKRGRLLELGSAWDTLQRCLTDGTLDTTAGEPPLNQTFLGGRLLYNADDAVASFVRPDMTPYVAEALGEVKYEDLRKKYFELDAAAYGRPLQEKDLEKAWVVFQQLRTLYEFAAEDISAVMFFAYWKG
ncbi:MAG: DUF1877 family protein [Pirellulales bacterium]